MPISTIWILKYVQQCYVKWFWTISSLGAPEKSDVRFHGNFKDRRGVKYSKKKIMNRLWFVILLKCYFIVIHIGHYHHHIYLFVYYKLLLPSLLLLLITILKSLYWTVIIVTGGCFQKVILRLLGCYDSWL